MSHLTCTYRLGSLQLDLRRVAAVTYSLHHCRLPLLSDLHLTNTGTAPTGPVTLSVTIVGYSASWEHTFDSLAPGGSAAVSRVRPVLDHLRLEGMESRVRSTLQVLLNGQLLANDPIDVLGFYEWPLQPEFRASLASFVQPGSPAVQQVMSHASGTLQRRAGTESFAGFLSAAEPDRAATALQAIYDTIAQRYGIRYELAPGFSQEDTSQAVRPPHRVLPAEGASAPGQGTCLDLCLLLAACMESVHLRPLIVVVRTGPRSLHALTGCRADGPARLDPLPACTDVQRDVATGRILLVEATGLTVGESGRLSFRDACSCAHKRFSGSTLEFVLDVSAARAEVPPLQFPMRPAVTDIMSEAARLARAETSTRIEASHLLVSFFLSRPERSPALAPLLTDAGVDTGRVRAIMRIMLGHPAARGPAAAPLPTLNYRRIVEDARLVAEDTGSAFVELHHLLYGLLHSRSQRAALFFRQAGIDRDRLADGLDRAFRWSEAIHRTVHDPEESSREIVAPLHALFDAVEHVPAGRAAQIAAGAARRAGTRLHSPIQGSTLRTGDCIGGTWIVLERIGSGRLCAVYLALDAGGGRPLAVKTLRDEFARVPRAAAAFRREAELWVALSSPPHPNVMAATGLLNVAGNMYVAMEYIPPPAGTRCNASLRSHLSDSAPLPVAQALRWALQVSSGMAHARTCGMRSHGDLRPENLFVAPDGRMLIADFGLARSMEDPASEATVCGHPAYMAPERFSPAARSDAQQDIYSFGVVLFEMLTGHLPFCIPHERYTREQDWITAWQHAHCYERAPRTGTPLDPFIADCLSKQPGARPADFATACERLLAIAHENGLDPGIMPARTPDRPADLIGRAGCLYHLGRAREALLLYDRALGQDETCRAALCGRGLCLLSLNRPADAQTAFTRVLQSEGDCVPALLGAARSMAAQGRAAEAEPLFDRVGTQHPGIPSVWYHRGIFLLERERYREASECFRLLLDMLISRKCIVEARAVIDDMLGRFPGDMRLQQLKGLALRLGDPDEQDLLCSRTMLEGLITTAEIPDQETTGLLAGACKRLWLHDPARYADCFLEARRLYDAAWEQSGHENVHCGINAATLALAAGDAPLSRMIAREISLRCSSPLPPPVPDRYSAYWYRTTRAEAELLLGRIGRARRMYCSVMDLFRHRTGCIETTLRQLGIILPRLGLACAPLDFLEPAAPPPGFARFRIALQVAAQFTDTDSLDRALCDAVGRAPRGAVCELVCALETPAERTASVRFLQRPGTCLTAMLSGEPEEWVQAGGDRACREKTLALAEEVIVNRWPGTAGYHALLIAADGDDDVISPAVDKALPRAVLRPGQPGNVQWERLDALPRTISDLKGATMYTPRPIDTDAVELSEDLIDLTELLAHNVHDLQARRQQQEGWSYGPHRDDAARTSPDLVHFDDLDAHARQRTRCIAAEILKTIQALGYRIQRSAAPNGEDPPAAQH